MTEQEYIALLDSLRDILQEGNSTSPIEIADENLNSAVASQSIDQDIEYDKRNNLYTDLLNNYIQVYRSKEKVKSIYKAIFFVVTMILFCGIVITCLISMIMLSIYGDGNLANVGIAISNVAGIVSTLIVLPKIIAEHLFPVNEESNMIGMVKNMQDNDANIRNVLFKMNEDQDK